MAGRGPRGGFQHHERHGGVVGPFARLPVQHPAADHVDVLGVGHWRLEFVGSAEGVAGRGGHDRADGALTLLRAELGRLVLRTVHCHVPMVPYLGTRPDPVTLVGTRRSPMTTAVMTFRPRAPIWSENWSRACRSCPW